MIATLTGKVAEKEAKFLVLDVHGVGYKVSVLSTLKDKVRVGQELTLRIHHHISDDSEDLYGFETKRDLSFFELLLTVPSVGPRTAIGILEVAPPAVLEQAVAEEDKALLTKVSGVGRKTAERILIELKGKIKDSDTKGISGGIQNEAMEALVSIGYTKLQARDAVQKLPKDVKTVEEAVKQALRSQSA